MKEKCVFFMSSTILRHTLISFCDSFQSSIDLAAWEAVTRSYMTVWIKLGFDKMWAIRMIFCLLANKHLSKTISGITDTLINLISVCLPFFLFFPFLRLSFLPSFFPSLLSFLHSFLFSVLLSILSLNLFEVVSKTLQIFSHRDRTVSNFHRNSRKKKQYEASATTVTCG